MITGGRKVKTEAATEEEYDISPPENPIYELADPEQARIVMWRLDCFEKLGFTRTAATALAIRRDIERTRVEGLVAQGAFPHQVIGILL